MSKKSEKNEKGEKGCKATLASSLLTEGSGVRGGEKRKVTKRLSLV